MALRRPSRATLWLLCFLPVAAISAIIGSWRQWSSTTVAVVIAVSAAYLMFPPMIVALTQWGARVGNAKVSDPRSADSKRPTREGEPRNPTHDSSRRLDPAPHASRPLQWSPELRA